MPNTGYVREGKSNYQVPQKIRDHMKLMWQQVVEPMTGLKDYEQLQKAVTLIPNWTKYTVFQKRGPL